MNRKFFYRILISVVILASCSSVKNHDSKFDDIEKNKKVNIVSKNEKMTKILFQTSMGDITIALYNETPKHKENFIKLVNEHYYDGVLFHRIIQNFMIQTGDPDSKNAKSSQMLGNGGPGYTIPAEFVSTRYHKRGAVAAARQGDHVNPTKASSGSQFYIVDGKTFSTDEMNRIINQMGKTYSQEQVNTYTSIGGAPHLDGDYTVFGEVINGMDIVDKIAAQPKDRRDRPITDIKILGAKIIE